MLQPVSDAPNPGTGSRGVVTSQLARFTGCANLGYRA